MNAEIISVGTELILGETADTNATYLASQLPLLGASLHRITVVDDNMERLVEAFRCSWERSDLILATGGLGPTQDDITREAIAQTLGETIEVCEPLLQDLRGMFSAMGRSMAATNVKQAGLIPSAVAIPNPRGTAPGWWVERDGRLAVAMPGPPAEMQRMWEREVMPKLKARAQGQVVALRTLKCFGLSEAEVGEKVSGVFGSSNPSLGVYARPDGIHLRVIAKAAGREEAEEMVAESEARLRSILGRRIWGTDEDTLAGVVSWLLVGRRLTLATMESCTGGLLGSMLTDVPGSSAYYKGGTVAYSAEVKVALGVEADVIERHGAVSEQAAVAMAEAVRHHLKADIGVGTTGAAGPAGMEGKPPGLAYIGLSDRFGQLSVEGRYPPARAAVKHLVAAHALFLLRNRLVSHRGSQ